MNFLLKRAGCYWSNQAFVKLLLMVRLLILSSFRGYYFPSSTALVLDEFL